MIQKRQQGKTENGEEVPFDRCKEASALGFQLVATDTMPNLVPIAGHVIVYVSRREMAHRHAYMTDVAPNRPTLVEQHGGRIKIVAFAGHERDLTRGLLRIPRFGERPSIEIQYLIAAKHELVGVFPSDLGRFEFCQMVGHFAWSRSFGFQPQAQGLFIDRRRKDREGNTGIAEEGSANFRT